MIKDPIIEVALPPQANLPRLRPRKKRAARAYLDAAHLAGAAAVGGEPAALLATLLPEPGRRDERRKLLARMAGRVVEAPSGSRERMKEETRGRIFH